MYLCDYYRTKKAAKEGKVVELTWGFAKKVGKWVKHEKIHSIFLINCGETESDDLIIEVIN